MTAKQARLTVLIAFSLVVLGRLMFPPVTHTKEWDVIVSISIELIGGLILLAILNLLQNMQQLWFYFQTKVLLRNREVRLSIAYLFRINVGGKYLLVKSRLHKRYQPVGGAFKTLPGAEKIFRELQVRPDRKIETEHGVAKRDLRIYVRGGRVIDFLSWFDSKEDRETSPWREFCEELLTTNILPHHEFRYIDYHYRGTVKTPIITLDNGDKGMFLFEVFDLEVNDEQRPLLEALKAQGDKESHIWATDYLIQRLGHDEGTKNQVCEIAPHTKWVQNMKWSKG